MSHPIRSRLTPTAWSSSQPGLLSLALLLASSAACLPVFCTAEAVSSLEVTVVLEDGTPIDDAVVTASLDGAVAEPCVPLGDGAYGCPFFEQAGTFTVTASKDGFDTAETTATVEDGQCHVGTQAVELQLSPVATDG